MEMEYHFSTYIIVDAGNRVEGNTLRIERDFKCIYRSFCLNHVGNIFIMNIFLIWRGICIYNP